MSPRRTRRPPDRDEPLLVGTQDPVRAGFARARRRALGRTLVGFLAFAAIWAGVVGLAALFDWPLKHAMYLGLVASIAYAVYRERRRRRTTDVERIGHRRRWRGPIDWTHRAPGMVASFEGCTTAAPRRRRGPLGGRLLSNSGWGEVLLWIIVAAVMITAFVAWVAHSKNVV